MLYHGLDTRTIVEPVLTSATTSSAFILPNASEAEKTGAQQPERPRLPPSPRSSRCHKRTRLARSIRREGYSTGQQSARPSGLLYRELIIEFAISGKVGR